jgi:hypothetical protein
MGTDALLLELAVCRSVAQPQWDVAEPSRAEPSIVWVTA